MKIPAAHVQPPEQFRSVLQSSGAHRLVEAPEVGLDNRLIQPKCAALGYDGIVPQRPPRSVHELIEGVARRGVRTFGPEISLKLVPRQASLPSDGEECKEPETSLLLRAGRDNTLLIV